MELVLLDCSRHSPSHLPTLPLTAEDAASQPSFPCSGTGVICLLLFGGNSLAGLSLWPLDEPVCSSSHSKADKLLWVSTEIGNSQHFFLRATVGCAMGLSWHTPASAFSVSCYSEPLCLPFKAGHNTAFCCPWLYPRDAGRCG